jgi:hypothetical protein
MNRAGFLRKKEHPVSLWILLEMARIDNGVRPICGEGETAIFADQLNLSLSGGRGTQAKFLYSVLDELKGVNVDMYTSRSDFRNPGALAPQLAAQEVEALETAFQHTLEKWSTATREWLKSCKAARNAGGKPPAVTLKQSNERLYFHWKNIAWHGPVIAPRLFQQQGGKSSSASRIAVCAGWFYILALGLCCASLVDRVSSAVLALIVLCLSHTVFIGFSMLA